MADWIDEIVEKLRLEGVTTTSEMLVPAVVREVVYRAVEKMLVGTKLLPTREVDFPFRKLAFPSSIDVAGPMAWQATAPADVITWTELEVSFDGKYEARFIIDDYLSLIHI